jgi:hypothetical protein
LYAASLPGLRKVFYTYIDHILKGANPGDLPIQQPSLRFLHELERGKTTARLDKVLQALAGLGMAFDIAPARGLNVREQVLERRHLLRRLAMAHGVRAMSLFGSGARGEAGPQSDLDFLVELDRGRTLLDLLSFKGDLEALFGRNVDVFTANTLKPRVLATARQDLVRVF